MTVASLSSPTYTFRRSRQAARGVSLRVEMVVDPSVVGMPVNGEVDMFGTAVLDLVEGEICASKGHWQAQEAQGRIENQLADAFLPRGVLCYSVEMWSQNYSISLTSYPS